MNTDLGFLGISFRKTEDEFYHTLWSGYELAILCKRAKRFKEEHKVFASNFDILRKDAKAVHEYAQTKVKLASMELRNKSLRKRLNQEAAELLHRAIQLSDDDVRAARCWYNLARTLNWLRAPEIEILMAYTRAMELLT